MILSVRVPILLWVVAAPRIVKRRRQALATVFLTFGVVAASSALGELDVSVGQKLTWVTPIRILLGLMAFLLADPGNAKLRE